MESLGLPGEISDVVRGIVEKYSPQRIYMFSNKRGTGGKTASFKLCVIMACDNRDDAEREIYRGIDSEVPFDIVVYSPGEWRELADKKGSFARAVSETGVLLHE